MRVASIALCLALVATGAHAISRYTSTSMSCAEIKATLQSEGAAILQWRSTRNPSLPLYGRYVVNRRFCQMEEVAETNLRSGKRRKILPRAQMRDHRFARRPLKHDNLGS